MRRILLTGASGFVGRHLASALVAGGFEVVACARAAPRPAGVDVRIIEDIASADWALLLAGVDAIVHAAGLAHTRGVAEADYERVNTQATLRLAAQAAGRVGRLVFLSSIRAMAGPVAPGPSVRPAAPSDAYGRSKLKAEEGLAKLGLPSVSLRPVVVYGEWVKGNLARLQRLADSALPLPFASLRQPRSFLSIDNLVGAILFALEERGTGAQTFLVADPAPSSIADLIAGLREGLGRGANLYPCPPGLLGAAARLAGQGESWRTMAGPMAVSVDRLLGAGWSPAVATSREGARRWGRAAKGR